MMKMPTQKLLTILLVLMLVLLIVGNSLLTAQPRLYVQLLLALPGSQQSRTLQGDLD